MKMSITIMFTDNLINEPSYDKVKEAAVRSLTAASMLKAFELFIDKFNSYISNSLYVYVCDDIDKTIIRKP